MDKLVDEIVQEEPIISESKKPHLKSLIKSYYTIISALSNYYAMNI